MLRARRPRTSWLPDWPTAVEIQVAYAIGVAHPLSVNVETFGTGKIADDKIAELISRAL